MVGYRRFNKPLKDDDFGYDMIKNLVSCAKAVHVARSMSELEKNDMKTDGILIKNFIQRVGKTLQNIVIESTLRIDLLLRNMLKK